MTDVHFSHGTDEWATPQRIFNQLAAEFGPFDCDVAASKENTKCKEFFDISTDGLHQEWKPRNWCNPPYSELKEWVTKARREQLKGNLTVMLIPARTDTVAFHESMYNKPNVEIRFLRGRLRFGDAANSAPFPSMVVIFK
jgi:phage N-6-adenine-methyltransferase